MDLGSLVSGTINDTLSVSLPLFRTEAALAAGMVLLLLCRMGFHFVKDWTVCWRAWTTTMPSGLFRELPWQIQAGWALRRRKMCMPRLPFHCSRV